MSLAFLIPWNKYVMLVQKESGNLMFEQNLLTSMESFTLEESPAALLLLAACGLLCCFFGYRTTRFLLDAIGFVTLGLGAALLAGAVSDGHLVFMGVALLVGGIAGGLLAHFVYRLGVALFVGGACAFLAWHIMQFYDEPRLTWVIVVAAALSGGLLAGFLSRLFISLATAVSGGLFVARGMFGLLAYFEITPRLPEMGSGFDATPPLLISWLALTVAGFIFQLLLGGRKKDA